MADAEVHQGPKKAECPACEQDVVVRETDGKLVPHRPLASTDPREDWCYGTFRSPQDMKPHAGCGSYHEVTVTCTPNDAPEGLVIEVDEDGPDTQDHVTLILERKGESMARFTFDPERVEITGVSVGPDDDGMGRTICCIAWNEDQ
jgi:hypothetical protein